jgi:hypothetical protein
LYPTTILARTSMPYRKSFGPKYTIASLPSWTLGLPTFSSIHHAVAWTALANSRYVTLWWPVAVSVEEVKYSAYVRFGYCSASLKSVLGRSSPVAEGQVSGRSDIVGVNATALLQVFEHVMGFLED